MCGNLERDELLVLRGRGHLRENAQIHLSHADSRPGEPISDDAVLIMDWILYLYLMIGCQQKENNVK